jgi:hypothetical protein
MFLVREFTYRNTLDTRVWEWQWSALVKQNMRSLMAWSLAWGGFASHLSILFACGVFGDTGREMLNVLG